MAFGPITTASVIVGTTQPIQAEALVQLFVPGFATIWLFPKNVNAVKDRKVKIVFIV